MTLRLLLCCAVLLGMALPLLASEAEPETVSFSAPSKVGTVVLPPGLYRLKVQGSIVFFTDLTTKKSYTALVKVEKTPKKSSFTAAQGRNVDGIQQVDAIVLQGAEYKLVF
jgi:hypothetical protein